MKINSFPIDPTAVRTLLGFRRNFPVSIEDMVRSLRVLFVPGTHVTPRLRLFGERLRSAFCELGVREIEFRDALNSAGQLIEGVVPIFLGDPQFDFITSDQLPIQNLYSSQTVGIFDRQSPVDEGSVLQARLDSIVEVMTTHLVTLCVFITDEQWVMCTMNGAVASYENQPSIREGVLHGLIPKIAARVSPPRVSDMVCHFEAFDPMSDEYTHIVADYLSSIPVWSQTGLIAAHTSMEKLRFRSSTHQMLVTSYLDDRSGMSYGFLSWQLPIETTPAIPVASADVAHVDRVMDLMEKNGQQWVQVTLQGHDYLVPVPEVSVICTRSGCRKDQLDPAHDLVKLSLSRGKVTLATPRGIVRTEECRPSYDTYTILGSALGNSLVASLLRTLQPTAKYPRVLASRGLSLSHWHGYLSPEQAPCGFIHHGESNPGVCCSTPQSAIYALTGKLQALDAALSKGVEFLGDVHIEPHHGTNLCGTLTLTEAAQIASATGRDKQSSLSQGHHA